VQRGRSWDLNRVSRNPKQLANIRIWRARSSHKRNISVAGCLP
jgi:hypothetical protein